MTGCILLMHLDESSGEINDSSGNNNDGTIIGSVTYGETGKFETAISLDKSLGTNSIGITNPSSIFSNELSVEFWFKRRNTGVFGAAGKYEFFVRKGTSSGLLYASSTWFVGGNANLYTMRFAIDTSSSDTVDTTTSFVDTNWHHVVSTYNGTVMKIYVDGQLDNNETHSAGGNIESNAYDITIGSNHATHYSPNATMDEVAIYNRTLSADEILNHYKRGILRLNASVRSCDDSICDGESWSSAINSSPSNLSLTGNPYFQYKFDFGTDNSTYTPELYNVTVDYTNASMPNFACREIMGRPTNTSISINLINGAENTSTYIEYGNYSTVIGNYSHNTSVINATTNRSLIEFNLTGLSPDTTYYFRVMAKLMNETAYANSSEGSFRTRRADAPFTFTMLTDSHIDPASPTGSTRLRSIVGNMSANDNSDFAMFLGDNVQLAKNGSGTIPNQTQPVIEYELWRDDLHPDWFSIPLHFLIGNWEGETGWDNPDNVSFVRNLRKKYVPNPLNTTYSQGGGQHEDYYAFTWGNALFVVLNVISYTPVDPSADGNSADNWTLGTAQLEWLNETLQNSTEPWKFIMIHHTVGGNWTTDIGTEYGRGGGRAAYEGEQATVHQMMIDNEVQAFFHGHDHLFTDIVVDSIHYIQAGNAGHSFFFTAGYTKYWNEHGRTKVEVLTDELAQVYYVNIDEETVVNITLDRLAPRVNIISPSNNIWNNGNITFSFNTTDASNISNCSLLINGLVNQTNSTMQKDTTTNFTLNNMSVGGYNWSISCVDYAYNNDSDYSIQAFTPNTNTTSARNFAVVLMTNFTGNSTNLSLVNISNITNLVIDQPSYGMINFTESVNLSSGGDIDTYVNISNNSININTTALPALDKAARLTLKNINFDNPRVLKDGVACSSPACVEVSYDADTDIFIFDVTSFSTYSAGETPNPSPKRPSSAVMHPGQMADSFTLRTGSIKKFKVNNVGYFIKITDLQEDCVEVAVYSDFKTINLCPDEQEDIDLDDDGEYDISLTLKNILNNEAEITIKTYSGKVLTIMEEEDIDTNTQIFSTSGDDDIEDGMNQADLGVGNNQEDDTNKKSVSGKKNLVGLAYGNFAQENFSFSIIIILMSTIIIVGFSFETKYEKSRAKNKKKL